MALTGPARGHTGADSAVRVLCAVAALGAVAAVLLHLFARPPAPRPPAAAPEPRVVRVPDPRSAPVRLRIPALRIEAGVLPLALDGGGRLDPPGFRHAMEVGWYAAGPRPGEPGPAVLVGHRDAPANPGTVPVRNGRDNIKNAVFAKLGRLRPGDLVEAELGDGRRVPFRVTAVDTYRTERFPTERVYGPVPDPQLRLITCGGAIDAGGHWDSNVVVSAVAAS
ncbi:sortase domain-bontaining protein [Streptomyces sp. NPDC087658]|uniref:sortase domain-containing protein n=2 Tax=unclassified Streptomyces TaxID=2593676 RepID=UPI0037F435EA